MYHITGLGVKRKKKKSFGLLDRARIWYNTGMKKLFATSALALLTGCMSLYTRAPWTEPRIERCYQSSRSVAGLGIICMFPQCMSDCPGDGGFMFENIFTIPLGVLVECEALAESAVDTVCLPVDWPLSASRARKPEPSAGEEVVVPVGRK